MTMAALIVPAVGQEPPDAQLRSGEGAPQLRQPAELLPAPTPLPPIDAAEQERRLTLSEAEAQALVYHPVLREAAARVRAAQGNWLQVGLKPNPEIGYSGAEIGDEGTAGQQGGFVSHEFVTAGKLRLNRAVASREVAAAEGRLQIARLQLLTTVRLYYVEVTAAQRGVALARQLADITAQSVRVTEQRLQALDVPRVTLLQSQLEQEASALVVTQAGERYDAAWRKLATAIGSNSAARPELEEILDRLPPELDWNAVRERLLRESPELAELRAAVDRARWAVERASAGRVPNVNVQAGVAYSHASEDTIANVQVSMPLPIYDRNQGAIAEACGELAAAQAALDDRALALEQRLAVAMRDYLTARERSRRYAERVLPVARESLELINRGYQEGELDYLSVLSVQQTYAQNSLSYLQDLETAWKRWAEIDGLLVGTLPESPN
jgi:outer membrane protein, heavy metal efflux system